MAENTPKMTFAMIKPDAVRAGNTGNIIQRITDNGFKIRAMKLIHMTRPIAEGFYAVHRERPFFGELVTFMSSGPTVVLALEKENAVQARGLRRERRRERLARLRLARKRRDRAALLLQRDGVCLREEFGMMNDESKAHSSFIIPHSSFV
jgi:hypothetical protein